MNCSGCGEVVTGTVLNAFGMGWHPSCLGCNICGKDFSDVGVVVYLLVCLLVHVLPKNWCN